jgi:hypothetical protein
MLQGADSDLANWLEVKAVDIPSNSVRLICVNINVAHFSHQLNRYLSRLAGWKTGQWQLRLLINVLRNSWLKWLICDCSPALNPGGTGPVGRHPLFEHLRVLFTHICSQIMFVCVYTEVRKGNVCFMISDITATQQWSILFSYAMSLLLVQFI